MYVVLIIIGINTRHTFTALDYFGWKKNDGRLEIEWETPENQAKTRERVEHVLNGYKCKTEVEDYCRVCINWTEDVLSTAFLLHFRYLSIFGDGSAVWLWIWPVPGVWLWPAGPSELHAVWTTESPLWRATAAAAASGLLPTAATASEEANPGTRPGSSPSPTSR